MPVCKALTVIIASTAPAAPNRWPSIDFEELTNKSLNSLLNTFLIASLPETMKIERSQRITIYSKIGDLFSIIMGSIALIACLVNYFQSFRKINQKTLPVDWHDIFISSRS